MSGQYFWTSFATVFNDSPHKLIGSCLHTGESGIELQLGKVASVGMVVLVPVVEVDEVLLVRVLVVRVLVVRVLVVAVLVVAVLVVTVLVVTVLVVTVLVTVAVDVVVGQVSQTIGHLTSRPNAGSPHKAAIPASRQASGSGTSLHHLDLSTVVVMPFVVVSVLVVVDPGVVGMVVTVVDVFEPAAVVAVVVDVVFGQYWHSPGH